jgi:hypothetical protein
MAPVVLVQFQADLPRGASAVAEVFASLPRHGEETAWASQEGARAYCEAFPPERADVGGYYTPGVPEAPEEGVTTIITPSSGREVSFAPAEEFWTVAFGDRGSVHAASDLLAALARRGITPTHVEDGSR